MIAWGVVIALTATRVGAFVVVGGPRLPGGSSLRHPTKLRSSAGEDQQQPPQTPTDQEDRLAAARRKQEAFLRARGFVFD
eukprot:CAMPEP_0185702442 /NCGR_PEP_ID=MMETSP1164-20130828/12012_1 /TAXON_ID=1104430 /ORGANISM="Chrysoreinhardia sp, Strain CCMP2950" /LENGTH=79 /DNA_ID=CAMNT_0028369649 /DNA_START=57 /DNA_END=293 /DNA_ORIENTATION=-